MNRKYLFAGLLTLVAASGCAQQKTGQSSKDRVYYHDRRVGLGSNIPRSYSDSASANSPQADTSDADRQQLQQMTSHSTAGGLGAGGR